MLYIDCVVGNRDGDGLRWGVEPICFQLTELGAKISPTTHYEHSVRVSTAREVKNVALRPLVVRAHALHGGAPDERTGACWRGHGQGQAHHD